MASSLVVTGFITMEAPPAPTLSSVQVDRLVRLRYKAELASAISLSLVEFANPCQHAPYPQGRTCKTGGSGGSVNPGGSSQWPPAMAKGNLPAVGSFPQPVSSNFDRLANLSVKGERSRVVQTAQAVYQKELDGGAVKMRDGSYMGPFKVNHAVIRAHQAGLGFMMEKGPDGKSWVEHLVNSGEPLRIEEPPGQNPYWVYRIPGLDLDIKVTMQLTGKTSGPSHVVKTIIPASSETKKYEKDLMKTGVNYKKAQFMGRLKAREIVEAAKFPVDSTIEQV